VIQTIQGAKPFLGAVLGFLFGILAILVNTQNGIAQDATEIRLRVEQSALQVIPTPLRSQLDVALDESEQAQELMRDLPAQRAVPIFFIVLGIVAIPVIYDTVREMIREADYGGGRCHGNGVG
jgi:hypothetical protein